MGIRKARPGDGKAISGLLDQLGYPRTEVFIEDKIDRMFNYPDALLLVYEDQNAVVAFIALHFIPQIALAGDFARISYFVVDKAYRSRGIGHEMLEFCTDLARWRACDRLEVHSHARRTGAHRFYEREDFEESPQYYIKVLV